MDDHQRTIAEAARSLATAMPLEPLIKIVTPSEAEASWTLHVGDASLVPPLERPGGCYTYELTVTAVTTTETGLF